MRKQFRARRVAQLEEQARAEEWAGLDLVFTTLNGSPVQARYFDRELERLVVASGVPRLTSHGLRHTAATHMVRHAADLGELRAVADILGHSPEMLLRVYAHTMPESLRSVSERVGRRSAGLDA
jgi:integrase